MSRPKLFIKGLLLLGAAVGVASLCVGCATYLAEHTGKPLYTQPGAEGSDAAIVSLPARGYESCQIVQVDDKKLAQRFCTWRLRLLPGAHDITIHISKTRLSLGLETQNADLNITLRPTVEAGKTYTIEWSAKSADDQEYAVFAAKVRDDASGLIIWPRPK